MIDWIMKFLWFCPHGFCVFSLSFHMHEGVYFGQVAFILRPEDFCLVDRQILKTKWFQFVVFAFRLDTFYLVVRKNVENQVVSFCCV